MLRKDSLASQPHRKLSRLKSKAKQKREPRSLFVWAGRTGLKMPFFLNASLERHPSKSGSIPPLEIIPHRFFQQIRMHFPAGNHPSQTFPTNQDAFSRWKSSLTDFSNKSGCISSLEIIPPRHFLLIRMHFLVGNHPSQIFLANQDQSPRWKSSLTEIFSRLGYISPPEIIPPRHFQQIRMHFPAGNHPSQTFPANQDAFLQRKSSLQDISNQSG